MPDGNQITANAADGTQHIFPAGTDMSVVDAVMKRYASERQAVQQPGAFQQRSGGPVLNAKNLATDADADNGPSFSGLIRDAALKAGQSMVPNAGTSGIQNLKNIGTGLNEQVNKAATTPWGQGGPLWGVLSMLANGLMSGVHGAATGIEQMGSGVVNRDPQKVAEGGGSALGNLFQVGALKEGPKAVSEPAGFGKSMSNLMNEGPAKAEFLGRQYDQALAHQQHIQQGVENVKSNAVQAITQTAQKIDAAHPNGIVSRADVKNGLTDVIDSIVGDDRTQVPGSLKKLIADEKADPRSTGPTVGGRHFDLSNPSDLKSYQKLKESGAFTPSEIARMEGTSGTGGKMSFQDLMQARTKLGYEMRNLQGPAKAIASACYAKLSEQLRSAARDAGVEKDWLESNSKYSQYKDLHDALSSTLEGQDPKEIMKPFSDTSRARVMNLLSKYGSDFGFDLDKIKESTNIFNHGEKMDKLVEPTRRTAMIAAISPKTAAASIALPRALRSEGVTKAIYGQGFEPPTMKPSQVYPSAKAAAKAAQSGKPPQGGSGSASSTVADRVLKQSVLEETIARDAEALKNPNLSLAERKAILGHMTDFQQMLAEHQ